MYRYVSWTCLAVAALVSTASAQVADLYLDAPLPGSVGDGQSAFYRLSVPTSVQLVLTLQNGDGASRHHLYIQRDVLPTTEDHLASSQEDRPEQVIEVADLQAGTYYVMVRGIYTFWGAGYTILARTAEQLPSLVLGEGLGDGVSDAQSRFYRIDLGTPGHLVLTLQNGDGASRHHLYIQRNVLPTTEDHLASSREARPEQVIEMADLQAGTYYVMVRGIYTFWGAGYTILARTAEQLPSLVLGEALGDGVSDAQSRFYRLDLGTPAHLVLTLQNGHGASRHHLYIQRDVLPTADFYMEASEADAPEQLIEIANLAPGPYYVMVRGIYTFWGGGYSILATDLDHPGGEPEPTLWASTYRGATAAQVTVRVWAVGLAENAQVSLLRDDGTTIEAEVTPELDGYLAARFNLTGAALGEYDLVAINPDGHEFSGSQPFIIEAEQRIELWADIVGRNSIRAGREQTYWIRCGNSGNIDAHGVILWIGGIPTDSAWNLGMELTPPFSWTDDVPLEPDSIPIELQTDDEIIIPLLVGPIAPGSIAEIPLMITVPSQREFSLNVAISGPLYGSEMSLADRQCIAKIIEEGLKEIIGAAIGSECVKLVENILAGSFEVYMDHLGGQRFTFDSFLQVMGGWTLQGAKCAAGIALPPWARIPLKVVEWIQRIATGVDIYNECRDTFKRLFERTKPIRVMQAIDPNEKVGPAGYGDGGFIPNGEDMMYVVYFENVESATAPAQEVVITDQLDLATLDGEELELGQIAFGDTIIDVPPRLTTYSTTIDLRPDQNLNLRIAAELDQSSGQLTWTFTSLDPETGELTEDPLAGFLPPNREPPEGEGYVMFTIRQEQGLPTGTEIRNRAPIAFDANPPIDTNEVLNTIDAGNPISSVNSLAETQTSAEFEVSWTGEDDAGGSGIRDYTIYVATDDGDYELWLANTADASATFTGEDGHAYKFYSRATDNVGHTEGPPSDADAETRVSQSNGDIVLPPPCGACGTGAPVAMIMGLCAIGLGKSRYRRKDWTRSRDR